jgi:hypothetical protein
MCTTITTSITRRYTNETRRRCLGGRAGNLWQAGESPPGAGGVDGDKEDVAYSLWRKSCVPFVLLHGAVLREIGSQEYVLGRERVLTAVAYVGGAVVEAFVAHFAVGQPIPEMPLFLTRENYIRVPLEAAYMAAWQDVPPQYQEVLLASS